MHFSPYLRVFHDTDLSHHKSSEINAAAISNIALLAYLRYPFSYLPYGFLQLLNRIAWCIKMGRFRGILTGLIEIPFRLWTFRSFRSSISHNRLRKILDAKRQGDGELQPLVLDH